MYLWDLIGLLRQELIFQCTELMGVNRMATTGAQGSSKLKIEVSHQFTFWSAE